MGGSQSADKEEPETCVAQVGRLGPTRRCRQIRSNVPPFIAYVVKSLLGTTEANPIKLRTLIRRVCKQLSHRQMRSNVVMHVKRALGYAMIHGLAMTKKRRFYCAGTAECSSTPNLHRAARSNNTRLTRRRLDRPTNSIGYDRPEEPGATSGPLSEVQEETDGTTTQFVGYCPNCHYAGNFRLI